VNRAAAGPSNGLAAETAAQGGPMASKDRKNPPQAPTVAEGRVPPHPKPDDPKHKEWLIDEGEDESFPASDPNSATQPKPRGGRTAH